MTNKRVYSIRTCTFCNEEYKQTNHEAFCPKNPNKKIRKGKNQFSKARENGYEFIVSDETKRKLSIVNTGRKHSEETISNIRKGMQRAVKENPNSYAGGYNRGRVKTCICSNGFTVIGKWEQKFVEFCLTNNITIIQPNTGFSYEWKGKRTYFPDFYLPELDQWVEIKGYETERDRAKWNTMINIHKKNLMIIKSKEIKNLHEWWEQQPELHRHCFHYE